MSDLDAEIAIQFYNLYGHEDGAVVLLPDGRLLGSDERRQHFADDWLRGGGTGQSFVERFENWGNGYAASRRILPNAISGPIPMEDKGPLQ